MSLIDDALKRAQAAHQEGQAGDGRDHPDGKVPWTPPPLPDRSRMVRARVMRILGLALLAGLAVAVALVVAIRSRRPQAPPSPASAGVRAASAAAGLPPITSEVTVAPPPQSIASGPPPARGSRHAVPPAATAPIGAPQASEAAAADHEAARTRPLPPSTAGESARKPRAAGEPTSFAGEMPLPEGGKITLDGIVYSETNPVAVLNGRVTSPGGYVEGFTVSKIYPDKIELVRDGRSVSLTVR